MVIQSWLNKIKIVYFKAQSWDVLKSISGPVLEISSKIQINSVYLIYYKPFIFNALKTVVYS